MFISIFIDLFKIFLMSKNEITNSQKLRKIYISTFLHSDFTQTENFPENKIKTTKYT